MTETHQPFARGELALDSGVEIAGRRDLVQYLERRTRCAAVSGAAKSAIRTQHRGDQRSLGRGDDACSVRRGVESVVDDGRPLSVKRLRHEHGGRFATYHPQQIGGSANIGLYWRPALLPPNQSRNQYWKRAKDSRGLAIFGQKGERETHAQAEQGSAASIAILNHIADSRLVLLHTTAPTGRLSKTGRVDRAGPRLPQARARRLRTTPAAEVAGCQVNSLPLSEFSR
jgi:hypothetical protein